MKKNIFMTVIVLLGLLALVQVAVAAPDFAIDTLELGSQSQGRNTNISTAFTVRNTGTDPLTISLTHNIASQYTVVLGASQVSLNAGQVTTVPISIHVPENQEAGRVQIGQITGSAAGLARAAPVYITTEGGLVIDRVSVDIEDGDDESFNGDENNEEIDAKPGDKVTITIRIENQLQDLDMEDVEVTLESDDLDWDENDEIGDIDSDDRESVTFELTIPSDADEDNYAVDIEVDGDDEDGRRYNSDFSFDINVERSSHEISINSITISPQSVTCDRRATLNVNVENTGSNDEDRVSLWIESDALDISQEYRGIELDEGDDYSRTHAFTVPNSTAPGEYIINVWTYYDTDEESDIGSAVLTVANCGAGNGNGNNNGNVQCTNYGQATCVSATSYQRCSSQGTLGPVISCASGFSCQAGACVDTSQPVVPSGSSVVGPSYGANTFFNAPTYVVLLVVVTLVLLVVITVLLVKYVF